MTYIVEMNEVALRSTSQPFCPMHPFYHVSECHYPFAIKPKRCVVNNVGRYLIKHHIIRDYSVPYVDRLSYAVFTVLIGISTACTALLFWHS